MGGVAGSQHTLGTAADLWGPPVGVLLAAALTVPAFYDGGIGVYLNRRFLHVDVRGHRARWPAGWAQVLKDSLNS